MSTPTPPLQPPQPQPGQPQPGQPQMGQRPPMIRPGGPPVTAAVGQQPLQPLNQQRFPMQNQPPPGQPQQLPVSSAPATSTALGAPMMNRYKSIFNKIYRASHYNKRCRFYKIILVQ